MRFLIGLVIAILFTLVFRKAIRRVPLVFYLFAVAFGILLMLGNYIVLPPWFREYVLGQFQSNTLGMGFFTIVMFTGVFDKDAPIRKALNPIRAELSIIASLLTLGHVIKYGESYLGQLLSSTTYIPELRILTLVLAALLLLLLIPLTITSFKAVRAKMKPRSWQLLQRFAYVFYGLVFIHIFVILWEPVFSGSQTALVSMCVYAALGVLYVVLRLRQYVHASGARTKNHSH